MVFVGLSELASITWPPQMQLRADNCSRVPDSDELERNVADPVPLNVNVLSQGLRLTVYVPKYDALKGPPDGARLPTGWLALVGNVGADAHPANDSASASAVQLYMMDRLMRTEAHSESEVECAAPIFSVLTVLMIAMKVDLTRTCYVREFAGAVHCSPFHR